MLKRVLVGIAAVVMFVGAASAGPIEEGSAAYKAGDYTTAFRLWRPLAERGDARAENNVGVLYEKGLGVSLNYEAAADWYRKAAAQGHAGAQKNLADLVARVLVVDDWQAPPAVTANPNPTRPASSSDADKCASYGFQPGTDGFASCMERLDLRNQDIRRAAEAEANAAEAAKAQEGPNMLKRLLRGLGRGLSAYGRQQQQEQLLLQQQRPRQTHCQWLGNQLNCETW